jgi:hypothetical protein
MRRAIVAFLTLLVLGSTAGCAGAKEDRSGINIVRRTPDQFCRGTARSVAMDRYEMKRDGAPLAKALEANGGVAVIDAITRAVYAREPRSEREAADVGTAACLSYFR